MIQLSENRDRMRLNAKNIFQKGVAAVDPGRAVKRVCRRQGDQLLIGHRTYDLSICRNLLVIGAGKAAAPMAAALEDSLADKITEGIINVKYGHTATLKQIRIIEAGHPVPDKNGELGAGEIFRLAEAAGENDLIITLISGGGSALLPLPVPGLSLKDKQKAIKTLLACGAAIHEINTIRKHTSLIKGGGLAQAAWPAQMITLILSDVVGDDLDVIASGPSVPDSSTFADCMAIIAKYNIINSLPQKIIAHFKKGVSGEIPDTPGPDDPVFEKICNMIVGDNLQAINAAQKEAAQLGYNTLILSSMIEGETCDIALMHGAIAREVLKTGNPIAPPACILSGGETTVNIKGNGLGGRNQEFALAAAINIAGCDDILILSGGTDGNDGPTDAAGAIADSETVDRAKQLGLNPLDYLQNNDSYHFFNKLGDLLMTGPTNTNVMDLHIMLVERKITMEDLKNG